MLKIDNVTNGQLTRYDLPDYIEIFIFRANYGSLSWKSLSLICIILGNNNQTEGIYSKTEITSKFTFQKDHFPRFYVEL
jgi:hypothetical protein